jgi:hypothetical protein
MVEEEPLRYCGDPPDFDSNIYKVEYKIRHNFCAQISEGDNIICRMSVSSAILSTVLDT